MPRKTGGGRMNELMMPEGMNGGMSDFNTAFPSTGGSRRVGGMADLNEAGEEALFGGRRTRRGGSCQSANVDPVVQGGMLALADLAVPAVLIGSRYTIPVVTSATKKASKMAVSVAKKTGDAVKNTANKLVGKKATAAKKSAPAKKTTSAASATKPAPAKKAPAKKSVSKGGASQCPYS